VFDTLDSHVSDAYKVAPATAPGTINWNSTMLPNNIFNQLMAQYGNPTPNAVHQNNLAFIAPYNPKDPPELLFKRCADCQEIAIIAKVPYTKEQMLMNVVDLFTQAGIYARDKDNWDQKADNNKTYLLFRLFIQDWYQCCLTLGTITTGQGGYASFKRFAGLTTDDNVSNNNITETIAGTISSHMANLSASISA
jgi:hypothetical protein